MKSTNAQNIYDNIEFEEKPYYQTEKFSIHVPKIKSNYQTSS